MFAHPIYSLLLLAAPVALYVFVIRPWFHLDSEFWIGTFGAVMTAAPDLLVIITPLDFSPFLPQPWPAYTAPICAILIVLMRSFKPKPKEGVQ